MRPTSFSTWPLRAGTKRAFHSLKVGFITTMTIPAKCCQTTRDEPRQTGFLGTLKRVVPSSFLGGSGLLALLAPKCPICLAAYLSVLGLGGLASSVIGWLRPLGIGFVALALLLLTARVVRHRWSRRQRTAA